MVEDIKLACTMLSDEVGVKIAIPNKAIVGEVLHNSNENKIVQGVIGISYDDDPAKAIQLIHDILCVQEYVLTTDNPLVGVSNFGDSSIDISYRYLVPTV